MSKNSKYQKMKVFGSKSQPAPGAVREKTMSVLKDFVKRRYGLNLTPSGGKWDEKAQGRRNENPEVGVDKPDWRSGNFESQWSPDAAVHESAHLEMMPEGIGLADGQRYMDKQYADVQRNHGYMKQKQSSGEVVPMSAENPIRRRVGLPAVHRDVPVKPGTPERRTVDTDEPAATRLQIGDKTVDQLASARLMRPESRERMDMIDRGEIRYNPESGWGPGEDINSKINQRARDYSHDDSRKDAKTLMRNDDGEPKHLSSKEIRHVYEKGIHKPHKSDGKSWTGNLSSKGTDFHNKWAKEQHQQKLGELKSMPKPNLPKSEEGMAKTDNKTKQRHIIFSMDNPAHGQHDDNAHQAMVDTLTQNGAHFEENEGVYGGNKERSITLHNPDKGLHDAVVSLLGKQGQESYIISDGQNHKMKFLHGDLAGKHVRGSGVVNHDTEPSDNYTKSKDGRIYTYNFDFSKYHD